MPATHLRTQPHSHEVDGLARPDATDTSGLRSHNDACTFARCSSQRKKAANPARGTLDALAFSVAVRYLASQRPTLLGNPAGRQKLPVTDLPALCARSTGETRGMRRSIHLETDFGLGGRMARTKKEGNRALTIPIADAARTGKLLQGKSSWTGPASYRNGAQVAGRGHGPWRFGKRATVAPQTRPHVPAGDVNRQRRGARAPDRQSRPTESGDDSGDSHALSATGFDSV
jgi:hypothetical protein